jgi:cytidine deaminase
MVDDETRRRLIEAAQAARAHAYAPYSRYRVGAAVLAGGRVYAGCNVENASYGLTICAERAAVFASVAAGQARIDAVAVIGDGEPPTTPCGACRQVLHEFGPEIDVIMLAGDAVVARPLAELLPLAFGPEDLAAR